MPLSHGQGGGLRDQFLEDRGGAAAPDGDSNYSSDGSDPHPVELINKLIVSLLAL